MFDRSSGRSSNFRGQFRIVEPVYRKMEETAASQPNKEIGGMLFGRIDDTGELKIDVEQVVHIPERGYSNSKTHFEINPKFSSAVIDQYTPEKTYLGNWHSHLGYGGPSSGDHQQVSTFFKNNDFRDYLISIIMDRQQRVQIAGQPDYQPIIEVYQRESENTSQYHTVSVSSEDIELTKGSTRESHVQTATNIESGRSDGQKPGEEHSIHEEITEFNIADTLSDYLHQLVDEVEEEVNLNAPLNQGHVYLYGSGQTDEVVINFPISYQLSKQESDVGFWKYIEGMVDRIDEEIGESGYDEKRAQAETFDAFLSVSIPISFPEDEIFLDLSSRDLTKQLTIQTMDSRLLGENRNEVVETIRYAVEQHIPDLLQSQLLTVMRDNVEWSR